MSSNRPCPGLFRARLVYQWLLFGMTELEGPLYRWFAELREGTQESANSERFAAAVEAISAALDGKDWLLGDRLTVADIVSVGVLGSGASRGLLDRWPVIREYVARGEARPAHQAALTHGES